MDDYLAELDFVTRSGIFVDLQQELFDNKPVITILHHQSPWGLASDTLNIDPLLLNDASQEWEKVSKGDFVVITPITTTPGGNTSTVTTTTTESMINTVLLNFTDFVTTEITISNPGQTDNEFLTQTITQTRNETIDHTINQNHTSNVTYTVTTTSPDEEISQSVKISYGSFNFYHRSNCIICNDYCFQIIWSDSLENISLE